MDYKKKAEPAKEEHSFSFSVAEVKDLLIKAAKEARPDVDELDKKEWWIRFRTDPSYQYHGANRQDDRCVIIARGIIKEE